MRRKAIGKRRCDNCGKLQPYDIVQDGSVIKEYCRICNGKISEFTP